MVLPFCNSSTFGQGARLQERRPPTLELDLGAVGGERRRPVDDDQRPACVRRRNVDGGAGESQAPERELGRRLAGTVLVDQADDLVAGDRQGDVVDRRDRAEGFGDAGELEGRGIGGRSPVSGNCLCHFTILNLLRSGHAATMMARISTAPETPDLVLGLTPLRIRPLFSTVSRRTPSAVRMMPPLPPASDVPPTAAMVRKSVPPPTVAEPAPIPLLRYGSTTSSPADAKCSLAAG